MLPVAVIASSLAVGVGVYRPSVTAGSRVRFLATNHGMDQHDLAIKTAKGHVIAKTAKIDAGAHATLFLRLRTPGRYTLFCTIPGHEKLGMHATIVVKRRHRVR